MPSGPARLTVELAALAPEGTGGARDSGAPPGSREFVLRLRIVNTGGETAGGVRARITLPPGFTYVLASAARRKVDPPALGDPIGPEVVAGGEELGSLPAGGQTTLELRVRTDDPSGDPHPRATVAFAGGRAVAASALLPR